MIAITGATGFVGREVVRQLRAAGEPMRLVVREPARARELAEQPGVELFHGNVLYAPSLEGALTGVKSVIHLVGIIHEWKENTFERVHVQATRHVVDEAKRAGVKRFLHMSALGTRANGVSQYHRTKWAAEEIVRQSGLAWTIFRPSVIYGPGDQSVNKLAQLVRRLPFAPVLGNGKSKIQPVAVEAVARAFIAAFKNDASVGQIYDLCGPESFTWNALFDKILAASGLSKPKLHLPLPIARVQAALFEALLKQPPFNRDQVIMSAEDNVGDPQPAERDLMLAQEPFEQGLARMLAR